MILNFARKYARLNNKPSLLGVFMIRYFGFEKLLTISLSHIFRFGMLKTPITSLATNIL